MAWINDWGKKEAENKHDKLKTSQANTNKHNLRESLKDHFKIGRNKVAFGKTGLYGSGIGDGVRGSIGTYVYRNEKWVRKEEEKQDLDNQVNIVIKIK